MADHGELWGYICFVVNLINIYIQKMRIRLAGRRGIAEKGLEGDCTLKGHPGEQTTLPCGHVFCWKCADKMPMNKLRCPICALITGNQPDGEMEIAEEDIDTDKGILSILVIRYWFQDGVQGRNHPSPGAPYRGTEKTAYLRNEPDERELSKMLREAFDQKLVYSIDDSGDIVENGIKHLTDRDLLHQSNQYEAVFSGMRKALKEMGITK